MDKAVILKNPPKGQLRFGHPWIYKSQLQRLEGSPAPGELVEVTASGGKFAGIGYYNPNSEISVRFLSRHPVKIDKDFFAERIRRAVRFRQKVVRDTNAFRVVSSEADDLPGLIVDQYGETLVVQFLTYGMERLRSQVLEALEETIPCRGIYERSDSGSRRLEGLPEKTGWILRNCGDEVVVRERDVEFLIRFGEGHKTGFYFDQRDNRFLLRDMGIRGRALDVFCYEGAFGLHLAMAGWQVTGIEIQKDAVERGREHRQRNGIGEKSLEFIEANAFDELKKMEKSGARFDLVVLDPPSFVKKKSALEGALSGYKEILLRSMKLLDPEGLLAVFSCSYHVDENLLMQASLSAAMDVRRSLRLLKFLKQASDHPINPFIPETYYLKGFLFSVSPL